MNRYDVFIRIVETGSFTQAAAESGYTQYNPVPPLQDRRRADAGRQGISALHTVRQQCQT